MVAFTVLFSHVLNLRRQNGSREFGIGPRELPSHVGHPLATGKRTATDQWIRRSHPEAAGSTPSALYIEQPLENQTVPRWGEQRARSAGWHEAPIDSSKPTALTASLAVLTRDRAVARRHRAPSRLRLYARRMGRHLAGPRREILVDSIARRREYDRAVPLDRVDRGQGDQGRVGSTHDGQKEWA